MLNYKLQITNYGKLIMDNGIIHNRRNFLVGAVATAFGSSLISSRVYAQDSKSNNYLALKNTDDFQILLNSGKRLFVLDPEQEYSWDNIIIPSGTTIVGNGSTVKSASLNSIILKIRDGVDGISISGINFEGNLNKPPYGKAVNNQHIAIEVYKASSVTIENCGFKYFLGAGISMFNYNGNKRSVDMKVLGCRFVDCQYGWIAWYNCEYGILSNNHFTNCRVAIWNCSGNWLIHGNVVIDCRASYVVTSATNEIAFNTGGNFSHGNVTGNTFNHSNQSPWSATALKYGNGVKAIEGVYFDSVLPVTFTGNSLWYTNFTYDNSQDDFFLTGCTFSDSTITNNGSHSLKLTGCWIRPSVNLSGDITVI